MSQSLGRALDLLDLVSRGVGTLDALAAEVGVHKATVLRLLQTLERRGFVSHGSGHRYHVGPALFALASTALEAQDVRAAAARHLRSLAAETGQTIHLAAYQDGVVSYIDKVESRQPLRMYSHVGAPAPLHATAVGKVLLGGLDTAERERVAVGIAYERYTDRTIATPAALLAEVRLSAERGWAEDHEEHETFMNCVGAPVFGPDGLVAAAVSVSVPNVVLPYEGVLGLLPALLATTAAISAELGAPVSRPEPATPQPHPTPRSTEPIPERNPMTDRIALSTTDAPAPAHTFSQGVKRGPFLQVSGQGPVDPTTNEYLHPDDVKAQTVRTLQNVEAILAAGGATFDDVMMLRVYRTKREDFPLMNDAYGEFVGSRVTSGVLPARTTVFTGLPRAEMLVEIDALAVLG